MIINFNECGDLAIDVKSLAIWISSGDDDDQHPPAGALIEIDHEEVYMKLSPENANRLAKTLIRALINKEVDPMEYDFTRAYFIPPDRQARGGEE